MGGWDQSGLLPSLGELGIEGSKSHSGSWDQPAARNGGNSRLFGGKKQLLWKRSLVSKEAQECLGPSALHGIPGGLGLTGMSFPGQVGQSVIQIVWAKTDPFHEVLGNVKNVLDVSWEYFLCFRWIFQCFQEVWDCLK